MEDEDEMIRKYFHFTQRNSIITLFESQHCFEVVY